ncbi:MAG: integrase [Nitrospiria bacterium]
MVMNSKRDYLNAIWQRYQKADKNTKSLILDEFCLNCGHHRKHALRLLSRKSHLKRQIPKQKSGPKPVYHTPELLKVLKGIWFATDQMCSKKLQAALPLWLPFYEQEYNRVPIWVKTKLLAMSPSSIDRLLKPVRVRYKTKGLSATKRGTLLKNKIPIQTDRWNASKPGFLEADTVAHCGNSLAGDFVWSITFTDLFSAWTENRAVWNKGAHGVLSHIKEMEQNLPFQILGFDCDNGSEFLNHHLYRYFTQRPKDPVQFTRSRPYHKNDNAHVEQKNWSHVRQLLGYDRFDQLTLVSLINDLYLNAWNPFHNFFSPTLKLKEKIKVNSKYIKKYYKPKTPYQRLIESCHLSTEQKDKLIHSYQSLNPFKLKKMIESKLKNIFNTLKLPE